MQPASLIAAALWLAAGAACAQADDAPTDAAPPDAGTATAAFDGTWIVTLVCQDVMPAGGPIAKGYTYRFPATVKQGLLEGEYGKAGAAGWVRYVGRVQPGGTLRVQANGLTGNPSSAVGRVSSSTPYAYRLRGHLDAAAGSATRVDLRPCEASFSKL